MRISHQLNDLADVVAYGPFLSFNKEKPKKRRKAYVSVLAVTVHHSELERSGLCTRNNWNNSGCRTRFERSGYPGRVRHGQKPEYRNYTDCDDRRRRPLHNSGSI